MIFIDVDPYAPHKDYCSFWHGGLCDCHPDAIRSATMEHCHECDYLNVMNYTAPCTCRGRCICDRREDCPCVELGLEPSVRAV